MAKQSMPSSTIATSTTSTSTTILSRTRTSTETTRTVTPRTKQSAAAILKSIRASTAPQESPRRWAPPGKNPEITFKIDAASFERKEAVKYLYSTRYFPFLGPEDTKYRIWFFRKFYETIFLMDKNLSLRKGSRILSRGIYQFEL